jgi:molybdopterin converting factor small subunit
MKLFASLETQVEKHNSVLDGREKTLDSVRAQLVKESRNVLGSGSGI